MKRKPLNIEFSMLILALGETPELASRSHFWLCLFNVEKRNKRKMLITTLEVSEECRRAVRRSSGYAEGEDLRDVG